MVMNRVPPLLISALRSKLDLDFGRGRIIDVLTKPALRLGGFEASKDARAQHITSQQPSR
jgi:hypothetical protein